MVDLYLERIERTWRELEEVACDLCGSREQRVEVEECGLRLVRCARCGLVFCNPRPTAAEMQRFYAQYFVSDSEELWEEQMRAVFQREGAGFLLRRMEADRVLDVGCGYGFFLRMMRRAGWEAVGVEPSPTAARYARERLGLEVVCGRVEEAGLAPESFGAATLWYVLEHVPNPSQVLGAVAGLLKPGGLLIARVPNRNVAVDRMLARLGAWGRERFLIMPPRHLYDYDAATLGALVRKGGFEVLRVANAVPRSTGSVAKQVRRHAWHWKAELERLLSGGARLTGSSLVIYGRKAGG